MKSGLLLQEGEANGIVYNAKGDLAPSTTFECFSASSSQSVLSRIIFNADGTVTRLQNGVLSGPIGAGWVETTPTPPAWAGPLNYTITWTGPVSQGSQPPATTNTAFPATQPGSFPQRFDSTKTFGGGGFSHVIWTVTITNNSGGLIPSRVFFVDLKCEANNL